jgi:hypothetical protein
VKLAASLGLADLATQDPAFRPHRAKADAFHKFMVKHYAETLGGGVCSVVPASILASAALQRAASAYLFDVAGESGDTDLFVKASRLANDSRQNLMAAHEMCVREAAARPKPAQAWQLSPADEAKLLADADRQIAEFEASQRGDDEG